jgi:AcrR family transcriptional regulator
VSGATGTAPAFEPDLLEVPTAPAAADQRGRILAATLATVAERGYGASTVAQIATEAGVSRAVLARHFDDKEACYLATYDALVEWIGEGVRAALSRPGGWPRAVRTAVEAILDPIAADPRLARFCGIEAQRAGAPAFERHRAVVGELARSLRVGREHCAWGNELPDQLEETLVRGAIWSIARVAKSGGAESLRGLAPELTYFLLTPYLDVAEARRMAGLEQVRSR